MPDKWGRRLFTAGGVFLLLLGVVHSLSLFGKPVPANDTERQLLDLMSNYKFNVMGSMRSMDNFLRGFSISFMLAAFCFGALDLTLARTCWTAKASGVSKCDLAMLDDPRLATLFLCGPHGISDSRAADLCDGLAQVSAIA